MVHVRSDIALVHAAKDRYGNPMDTRFTSVEREKPYGEGEKVMLRVVFASG